VTTSVLRCATGDRPTVVTGHIQCLPSLPSNSSARPWGLRSPRAQNDKSGVLHLPARYLPRRAPIGSYTPRDALVSFPGQGALNRSVTVLGIVDRVCIFVGTRLGAGRSRNRGSIPGKNEDALF
jgi:hypothetical protein